MAAIYSNGGSRLNILGFNITKRDALSSVYKISMMSMSKIMHHLTKCSMTLSLGRIQGRILLEIVGVEKNYRAGAAV